MGKEVTAAINRAKKIYDEYALEQERKANMAKAEVDRTADDTLQQAYISNMQNKQKLPIEARKMGLSGGASETSLLKANTNYETTRGNIEKGRADNKAKLNENLRSTMAAYKLVHDQNTAADVQAARDREIAEQAREESRFAATVSGYDDIGEIDKFLAYIQRTGVAPWRADYLRARRAELKKELAVAQAASSGGGSSAKSSGGGGSSTYTSSTSSSSKADAIAAAKAALGGLSGSSSTAKATKDALASLASGLKTKKTPMYYSKRY